MSKGTNVQLIGLKDLSAALKKCSAAARGEALQTAAEAGGRVIEEKAKENIEKNFSEHSRGGLAGSMLVEVSGNGTKAEAKIGPSAVYGRIQEQGGTIYPVNAKLLSWIDPDSGKRVAAKRVTIKANPYLRPALDENRDAIERTVKNVLREEIEKVGK